MPQNFELSHDRSLAFLQIEVECATREFARVRMPLCADHLNGFGMAHGGFVCAIADTAFGVAANAGSSHPVVTMSLAIDFLRPGKHGPLVAEAKLTRAGGHIVSYNVSVLDSENQLIASALVSGYVTDAPFPGVEANLQTTSQS